MNDPGNDFDTCCGEARGVRTAPPHKRRVCQCHAPTCANYLCAVCGVSVPWHKNLMIANPTIAGRFCGGCIDVEAAYHGLSVEDPVDGFTLALNTALVGGGDALRLSARVHGSCEIHGWVADLAPKPWR